jgi:hypothetical protein
VAKTAQNLPKLYVSTRQASLTVSLDMSKALARFPDIQTSARPKASNLKFLTTQSYKMEIQL